MRDGVVFAERDEGRALGCRCCRVLRSRRQLVHRDPLVGDRDEIGERAASIDAEDRARHRGPSVVGVADARRGKQSAEERASRADSTRPPPPVEPVSSAWPPPQVWPPDLLTHGGRIGVGGSHDAPHCNPVTPAQIPSLPRGPHRRNAEPGTQRRELGETGSSASAKRRCARLSPRWPTKLDKIENLHPPDTIATENSGTRGRSIWVHSGLLDSSVPAGEGGAVGNGVAHGLGTEPG